MSTSTPDRPPLPLTLPWVTGADGQTANLDDFEVRGPGDPAKRDDELWHGPCGTHLCDVQPDDTLQELAAVAVGHSAGCVAAGEAEGRRIAAAASAQVRAALRLSAAVRREDGTWLGGADVISAVCDWLTALGIDPDTGEYEPEWDSADSTRHADAEEARDAR